MASHQWSLVENTPSSGKTFARPLGLTETSFYYDRMFNGVADIVWRYTIELADPSVLNSAGNPFCEQNIRRTWATLKHHYPLLGCRMEAQDIDDVSFVVSERALAHHRPGEVVVGTVPSPAESRALVWSLLREKATEDHHLIARVFVLERTDKAHTYEVIFKAAHTIADGISGTTLARTFLDVLCSPPVPVPALEERLAMALPSDALNPTLGMSLARQRWRRAIGKVTFLNMRRRLAVGSSRDVSAHVPSY
ncbi:hypothetical protein BN946_scf184985.g78 [Trametes cinnabarina]|uniref:Diacylglycerol O-acyltransferase n=1 Tax=Pycnoporus cinnabarinus TaxID=5643 RepID=A0A060SK90_PYCCI|nr:hypothetical protein BN946_scf184985.g78 [Trametes cinnabarina]